jgi:predicted RNase H-like nuclease (RuvC/YqgF family)
MSNENSIPPPNMITASLRKLADAGDKDSETIDRIADSLDGMTGSIKALLKQLSAMERREEAAVKQRREIRDAIEVLRKSLERGYRDHEDRIHDLEIHALRKDDTNGQDPRHSAK